jgi:hypothetical protein
MHASFGLHGGKILNWLGKRSFRSMVALNDLNIEGDITVEWNWLTTKRSLSVGTSVSVVAWAVESSLGSLGELGDCEFPALEYLASSECEYSWHTTWLRFRVSDDSA